MYCNIFMSHDGVFFIFQSKVTFFLLTSSKIREYSPIFWKSSYLIFYTLETELLNVMISVYAMFYISTISPVSLYL